MPRKFEQSGVRARGKIARKFEHPYLSIGHRREKLDIVSQRTIVAVGDKRYVGAS